MLSLFSARRLQTAAYPAAAILLLLIAAIHWIHPGYFIAQTDINPPNDIWNQVKNCVGPWNYSQSYLGQSSWCFTYSPVLFVHALITNAFGDSAANALSLALPYAVAILGGFYLGRVLGLGSPAALILSVTYVFNPFTQVIIGLNNAVPIFAAILPWFFALLAIAAVRPHRRNFVTVAIFGVCAFAVNLVAIMPHLLVDLAVALAIWCAATTLLAADRREFLKWLAVTAAWSALATAWWLIPSVISLASAQNYRPHTVAETSWTFARASLLNFMRWNSVWLWSYETYFPNAPRYDGNIITYSSGFLLIGTLIAALARLRERALQFAAFMGLAALTIFFISKGPHEPLAAISSYLMTLPILFVFQDPAGLIVIAALMLAIVAALLINDLESERRIIYFGSITFVTAAALVSCILLLDGEIFHGNTSISPSMYVHIPQYWVDLGHTLENDPRTGGVLFLPADEVYDPRYTWDYLGADTIPASITTRRVLLPGPPFGYFITPQRTAIYGKIVSMIQEGSPLAGPCLRDLGIRFVVMRDDMITAAPDPSPNFLGRTFPGAKIRRIGLLTLVELGTPRDTLTDWKSVIKEDTPLNAGDLMELGSVTNDERPRVSDPIPSTIGSDLREVAPKFGVSIDSSHRLVSNQTDSPFTARIEQSQPMSVGLTFDRLVGPAPLPGSPFVTAEAVSTRSVLARPLVSIVGQSTNFRPPYVAYNVGSHAVIDDVLARCHYCKPGSEVTLTAGDREYKSTVLDVPDGNISLQFRHVLWKPGFNEHVRFAVPPGGAIRFDDIFFDDHSAIPDRRNDLVSFYPADLPLFDHPLLSDPFIDRSMANTNSGFVIFLHVPRDGDVACFVLIDSLHSYDLYNPSLDCLRHHNYPTDPQSLAQTHIVGVAIDTPPTTRRLFHAINSKSRLVFMWNASLQKQLKAAGSTADIAGTSFRQRWVFPKVLAKQDLVDVFIPGAIAGKVVLGAATHQLPLIDGGLALGTSSLNSGTAQSLDIAAELLQNSSAGIDAQVSAWRPANNVAIAGVGAFHVGIDTPTFLRLPISPARRLQVHSEGIFGTSLITIGVFGTGVGATRSCDSDPNLAVMRCEASTRSLMVQNIGYHWSWVAMRQWNVLPHVRADGWRNAWIVEKGGTVTIFNVLDFAPLVGSILTLLGLGLLAFFRLGWYLRLKEFL